MKIEDPHLKYTVLVCLIVPLLGLVLYANTLRSSFHFDDEIAIKKNFAIRD